MRGPRRWSLAPFDQLYGCIPLDRLGDRTERSSQPKTKTSYEMIPKCKHLQCARSYRGNVQSTGRNVGTKEDTLVLLAELEKGCGSFLLLLLPVNVHHLDVNVVQQLRMKLD